MPGLKNENVVFGQASGLRTEGPRPGAKRDPAGRPLASLPAGRLFNILII